MSVTTNHPPLDFEGRWQPAGLTEGPLHHASHGPPPLQMQGRIYK
jgi:hypothetical protein